MGRERTERQDPCGIRGVCACDSDREAGPVILGAMAGPLRSDDPIRRTPGRTPALLGAAASTRGVRRRGPRARVARILPWTLPAGLLALAALLAGCSTDDSASTTTTSTTTTTTAPTTTTTVPGSGDPLPVAWVRQVGGPGDDVIAAVTGRGDTVVGVGTTTGLTPEQRPTSGTTAAFVDSVAASDGSPRATVQSTQADAATANGIASSPSPSASPSPSQPSADATTIACGSTGVTAGPGSTGAGSGGAGGADVWCAPVGADATIGTAAVERSDGDDSFASVAIAADGAEGYAVGRAGGLFPGAKDPTGGDLGGGDALVTRITRTGAIRWARQFGSIGADEATAVTTSDDGDAVVAGWSDGRTRADAAGTVGGRDAWIARMDQYGAQRWMTQFGSSGTDRALAVGRGGDPRRGTETFVAAGSTDGSVGSTANHGASDAMVSAFDASGRQRWAVQLGSTGDDEATGVAVDGTTVYVTGTTAGKVVGARQIPLTPQPVPGGGGDDAAPSTTTPSTTAPDTEATGGGSDAFLAAIDMTTGEIRWIAQFGSAGDEHVTGITRTRTGLVVVSGSTTGKLGATAPGGGTDGFMVAFVAPSGGGGAARIV